MYQMIWMLLNYRKEERQIMLDNAIVVVIRI